MSLRVDSPGADSVVVVGHAGEVLLLDAANGRTIWRKQLTEAAASACAGQPVSVAIVEQTVLVGCMGHVVALALADGALLWHVDHRTRGEGETRLAAGFVNRSGDFVSNLGFVPGSDVAEDD